MSAGAARREPDARWVDVGRLEDIPRRGARVVRLPGGDIALFRTAGDEVFALRDRCPHRGGPLSQGLVHDRRVTCPLHDWVIVLETGCATGPDEGCTETYAVTVERDGRVLLAPRSLAGGTGDGDA